LADAAWRASDSRLLVVSVRELRAVLARLAVESVPEGGAAADEPVDAGTGRDGVDDIGRELAELMGSGPTVCDAADP
jgi:hypothetical protein